MGGPRTKTRKELLRENDAMRQVLLRGVFLVDDVILGEPIYLRLAQRWVRDAVAFGGVRRVTSSGDND